MRNLVRSTLVALILTAVCAVLGFAQVANQPFTAPEYYATSFQLWSINAQSPNTYIFQGRSLCSSNGQNVAFFDFATNAPVWIADANTSQSEVKTPSAIILTAGSCGVTIAPSNNHYNFQLRSGTAGLQDAINAVKANGGIPATILLDRNWWTIANNTPGTSGTAIIAAAVGGPGVLIRDITTVPNVNYVWTGTAYAVTYPNWANNPPVLAAGAAAGSSPTVSVKAGSQQLSGTVNVTTGTATTTGTLFTLTFPTVANGGFQYAGTCTVTSTGTNGFTTFTQATSTTGSTTTLQRISTVTVTATPAVSTAYVFSYNCQ
jgi:hypothetical protein